MENVPERIILIGGAAGALKAVAELLSFLEKGLPAAIVVVLHLNREKEAVEKELGRLMSPITFARDSQILRPSQALLAPPDQHLMLKEGRVVLNRGPRVNLSRPSIDVSFRSAAVEFGSRTVGVIMSGLLDDGVEGLHTIQRAGGVTLVQSPDDALFQDLPQSVLSLMNPDHVLPARSIGYLLNRLVRAPLPPDRPLPQTVIAENQFSLEGVGDISRMDNLGKQVPNICPECQGPLWELYEGLQPRYRCHAGHSFSCRHLLKYIDEDMEKSLWSSYRKLEEKARLLDKLAQADEQAGRKEVARLSRQQVAEYTKQSELLRNTLNQLHAAI